MGFFTVRQEAKDKKNKKLLKTFGCKICPINLGENFQTAPKGSSHPDIYILSKYLGAYKDCGYDFEDKMETILSDYKIRQGGLIRCPNYNKEAVSCCEHAVIEDIETTKPQIILGLGEKVLPWALNLGIVSIWRGRAFPLQVGNHTCLFIPMFSPDYVATMLKKYSKKNEFTDTFEKDLKFVVETLRKNILPMIESPKDYFTSIESIYGRTEKEINLLKKKLDYFRNGKDSLGLDIETTTLKPYYKEARILSCAISNGAETLAFPIDHPRIPENNIRTLKEIFFDFLCDSPTKICHNLLFEAQWFHHVFGKKALLGTDWADTMAQAYIIDERQGSLKGQHPLSLNMLIFQHFGFRLKGVSKIEIKNLLKCSLKDLLSYNALDAKYTKVLYEKQKKSITGDLTKSYLTQVDSALTLAITQNLGVNIDWETWGDAKNEYEEEQKKILQEIDQLACVKKYIKTKGGLNLNAGRQIAYILENILKLPALKFTAKTHTYKVDEEVLGKFAEQGVDFARLILAYRYGNNMLTKYILSIPGFAKHDGMLHTDYHALLTRTGRLSSSNPNMQNFPKRKGKEMRSFIYLGESK